MQLEIGDLIVIELALAAYFKDVDIGLSAGQQIQQTIARIELLIQQINTAAKTQGTNRPNIPNPQQPNN